MHRDHAAPEGACCRVTWIRMSQGDMDRGDRGLPHGAAARRSRSSRASAAPSMLVNRPAGRGCGTVAFDSARSHGRRAADQAWTIRESGAREAGVDIIDVGEFELALAHLRLPELV